ncbi:hypothetical protein TELCIR_11089 [Teladorsagia circumcincta]|uniref:Amino acid transporter transmembrane domain-containing protein n=1 Tax=Teladorsagia circumcincta TaxID=45464 RepID=A0A2G9UAD6_TELCI|nr:hypothetical protein TELCIR_11089 [Teladorsagia circumcincta]
MSLVTIIYTYCGFYGYITFGSAVQGSVTLNLPDTTINVVVKILLVFVVFFGNVLQLYVIIEMLWPKLKEKLMLQKCRSMTVLLLEYLFRIGVVCFASELILPFTHSSIKYTRYYALAGSVPRYAPAEGGLTD